LAWGSRSKASSSSTASSTATLSLSEISASVRSSCLCATPPCFQAFVLSPLVPDELGVAALRPSRGGGHASGHRGRSTAVDCNKPCSSNTSRWSGCALSSSSQCTLACSLQPPYTPVPSPAADDTCLRTGQGPFQGRPNRIAARASTSSSWPSSPSRTARRGAEGTEAGNFRGGFIKGHLSGLSGTSRKKR
jgi:hypothetical protein